jgi:hypothetical protein
MSITINGTTGIAGVDGSASTPAFQGNDTDTGIFYPSANEVAAAAGGSAVWNASSTFGFKNRFINGAMMIDQRNSGASVTVTDSLATYITDRWQVFENGSMSFTAQRVTTAPTGYKNSLLVTSTSAVTPGSAARSALTQIIEGFNIADLGWGAAGASSVTLSFWIRSSLTGQFGGALQNGAQDLSYPFSFTISAANTFEYKTITIPGPTSGAWNTDNTGGVRVSFDLGMGSTLLGTAGSWQSADYRGATGDTRINGTNGATLYITGVQFEEGTVATSFDFRPYGTELALCQRYCYPWSDATTATNAFFPVMVYQGLSTILVSARFYSVSMRTVPSSTTQSNGGGVSYYRYDNSGGITQTPTDAGINVRGGNPLIGELNYTAASSWGSSGYLGSMAMNGTPCYGFFSAEL